MAQDHLLLVEDDLLILSTMARGLRDAGFDIAEAESAEEALVVCRQTRPDLAVLDIRLPGRSGLELARDLADEGIPFIFLTAHDDEAFVDQAEKAGALGYLVKPLEVPRMVPTLKTALARARDLAGLREGEGKLLAALENSRDISTAVGLLMARLKVREKQAFEILRAEARNQQKKIVEVARAMIAAERAPDNAA